MRGFFAVLLHGATSSIARVPTRICLSANEGYSWLYKPNGDKLNIVEGFLSSHPFSDMTKRTYIAILKRFVAEVEMPASITPAELLKWVSKSEWGNARRCVALACTKKYLAWAYGQLHPALGAKIKRIRGKVPRTIDSSLAIELLSSFDTMSAKGARDLAIASLLLDTGLRASEVCRLQQADTDTEHRKLQVLVKGGAWEWAIFTEETAQHIEHWKRFRERLNPRGFLFVHCQTGEGLTAEGLNAIVREWGKKIGVKMSPHDFRRGMATIASEGGAPDRLIMENGRWKSTQMVTRYTRGLKLEAMRNFLPMKKLREKV